ncbi:transposase, partial [Streptomyces cacaoi]
MSRMRAGSDSVNGHRYGLALDTERRTLLSRRIANDEPELRKLIGDVLDLADGRPVMPGRLVNRASDAYVIADQARMRRDLPPIRPGDEAAVERKLLTGRRADLIEDRTRAVNRLRGTLLSMFPTLERALEVTNAEEVMALNQQVSEMDELTEGRFREYELADILLSAPGIGAVVGPDCGGAVGACQGALQTPDAPAGLAGVAPATLDIERRGC